MSSLLAQQLEAHRALNPLPAPADAKKSRPTILFRDAKVQANVLDARQVLDLGRNGLQRLCAVNPAFKRFQAELFATAIGSDPRSERHLLPPPERDAVDEQCDELLRELAPYLAEEPAQQVLEFLLQRFNVHVTRTETLLSAALPYHETSLFSAITQLPSIPLGRTKWAFLSKMKLDERGITRSRLVKAMAKDVALFDEICRSCSTSSPRLFACFVLESLHCLVQDAAPMKQIEAHVQVAVHHALDCLKQNKEDNIVASCAIFSAVSRHAPFSTEAAESLLLVIARKLNHIASKERVELQNARLDLARCLVQVYEWQVGTTGTNSEIFAETERWSKFSTYLFAVLEELVEAEAEHSCILVTDLAARLIRNGNEEECAGIASKSGALIRSDAVHFRDRSWRILVALTERVKLSIKKKRKGADPTLRVIVSTISENQAEAFVQFASSLSSEDRILLAAAVFNSADDPLAIKLMPAENDMNLPLAIRDGRIDVRLAALRHLEKHPSKVASVLFADTLNDPSLLILENFLSEPTSSSDSDMIVEVELLLRTFTAARDTLEVPVVEAVQTLLRRAVETDGHVRSTPAIVAAIVKALARPNSDENALALLSIAQGVANIDNKAREDAAALLSKTWLQGASSDAGASAKALAKRLKKEQAESVEARIGSLRVVAPTLALALCEDLLETFASDAPLWALGVLEQASAAVTLQVDSAKALAAATLKAMDLSTFLDRAFLTPVHIWPRLLPLVAEVLHLVELDTLREVVQDALIPRHGVDDVRLVRALRVYKALLTAPLDSNATKTAPVSSKPIPMSAKKGKSKKNAEVAVNWTMLLPLLSYSGARQVRAEAVACLELLPGAVSEKLVARKHEIERDATAAVRALRSDPTVKPLLEQQALESLSSGTLQVVLAALDCSGDASLASQLLTRLVESEQEPSDALNRLVRLAFSFLSDAQSSTAVVNAAFVRSMCVAGLARFPIEVLGWLLVIPPKTIPGDAAVLDALVDAALGLRLPATLDIASGSDVAERSGRVLGRTHFKVEDVLTRLRRCVEMAQSKEKVTQPKTKITVDYKGSDVMNGEGRDNNSTSENVRRLCVLVDVAGSLSSGLAPSVAWDVATALFDVLKSASERGLALLEQTVLSALERIAISSAQSFDEDRRDLMSERLLKSAQRTSNMASRMSAIRVLERVRPTLRGFERAFRELDEAKSLERVVDTMCSLTDAKAIARDSTIVAALCEAVQRVKPANRVNLLRSFATRCESPAEVLSHWMRLSGSETDCSAIAGQFNAQVQTDLMIQLVDEGERGGLAFVAKHLASRTYMKALVEKEDADISQFIELFEKLLRKCLEVNALDEAVEGVKDMRVLVERALDGLTVLLSVPVFIPVISETLTNPEPLLRSLALRALKTKIEDECNDWTKEETRFVLEFAQTIVAWLESDEINGAQHTTVLALNILAQYLASKHKDAFVTAIPSLVAVLEARDEDEGEEAILLASAVCLCLGTICKHVTTHCLASLPAIIPQLIRCAASPPRASIGSAEVLRQASLAALKDIVDSGVALGSTLGSVVDVALSPDSDALDLLESLGTAIEPRLGLDVCARVVKETGSPQTSFERLSRLLSLFVDRMSAAEAVSHLKDFKDICVGTMVRAKSGDPRKFDATSIVKMGLLLSEKRLRELVDELLQTAEDDSACSGVLMEILRAYLEKCGSLFLPVLPFEFVLGVLQRDVLAMESAGDLKKSSDESGPKRVKRDGKEAALNLLEMSLHCVDECLVHAMNSGFVDIDKFDMLLPPLVSVLRACPVKFTAQFLEPCFANLALSTLSNSQANAMLQTLHHAVTRLLRSTSVQVRQAALSCIKTLFERVGNDYLVLMPDTLPFLAELLEDKDETVRTLAQRLALVLKDLSGEDISEFLK